MKMALPAVITTGQGSEFKKQLNDEMMKILNIRHHLITAYHPQVDKIKRVGGRGQGCLEDQYMRSNIGVNSKSSDIILWDEIKVLSVEQKQELLHNAGVQMEMLPMQGLAMNKINACHTMVQT